MIIFKRSVDWLFMVKLNRALTLGALWRRLISQWTGLNKAPRFFIEVSEGYTGSAVNLP
jgi:hypothetical protein